MLRESGAAQSEVDEPERASAAHFKGRKRSRKTVRALAEDLRMESWYWRIYSVACEPAHLGDLVDFMPTDAGGIEIGGALGPSSYRTIVAAHYGCVIMLALFDEINSRNEIGLRVPVDDLRTRLTDIAS